MIFCYSATKKTKVYAEVLGAVLDSPVFMLKSDLDPADKFTFKLIARCLWLTFTKKSTPVLNMPAKDNFNKDEIYICCTVWGGYPAAPIRFFLENAPIKGKKVHMILTASVSHMKYIDNGKKTLADAGCIPGNVEVFATDSKATVERDVIKSHICQLMFNEGKADEDKTDEDKT